MFKKFKFTIYLNSGDLFVFKVKDSDSDGLNEVIKALKLSFSGEAANGDLMVYGVHIRLKDVSAWQLENGLYLW